MAGWVSATRTIIEAQQRALQAFLPTARRLEEDLPATSGDKPGLAPRRRGRPPKSDKSASGTGRPRRGRPRKSPRAKA
jgi:hypothetical protein